MFRALDLDGDKAAGFMADFSRGFVVDLAGYEPAFHHRVGLAATRFSWPLPVPHFFGIRLPLSVSDLTLAAQSGCWPLRYPTLTPAPARDWLNWPMLLVALPVLAALVIWLFRAF